MKKWVLLPVKLRARFRHALRIVMAISEKIATGTGIFPWPGNRKEHGNHKTGKGTRMRNSFSRRMKPEGKHYQAWRGNAFLHGFWIGFWRPEAPPVKFPEIPTAEKIVADAWSNVGGHLRNAMAEVDRGLPPK